MSLVLSEASSKSHWIMRILLQGLLVSQAFPDVRKVLKMGFGLKFGGKFQLDSLS